MAQFCRAEVAQFWRAARGIDAHRAQQLLQQPGLIPDRSFSLLQGAERCPVDTPFRIDIDNVVKPSEDFGRGTQALGQGEDLRRDAVFWDHLPRYPVRYPDGALGSRPRGGDRLLAADLLFHPPQRQGHLP
ncbi:MAG: hypothetical protein GY854_19430 [Deltaproteobacteria bacterium]|nr:hypothetical protein [Deltaproteobacteria bacterium]